MYSNLESAISNFHISFLGLGAIGAPMAAHVAAKYPTTVWNRTESRSRAFLEANPDTVAVAESPARVAESADILITCMPTSAEVEELLFGESAAAQSLSEGDIVVDCTSGDPTTSRRIADRLTKQGVAFVDAPVSGGVSGALEGKLTVMCGGDEEVVDRIRPVLETFGSKIVHCGPVGCGHALKAVNNALLALHIWSTAEGLIMLQKLGVEAEIALEVINASSGRSNASMNLFPERVLDRSFPNTFRLALLDKDARIAADIAKEAGVPAETIALASRLFTRAHDILGNDADHVEAVKVLESDSGITLGLK